MAKADFANMNNEVAEEVLMEETTTAVAAPDQRALELGAMGGDVKASDLRLPRLQIAYGVGKLAASFSQGDLVLDNEHLLVHKKENLKIILWSTFTYWKEWLDNDAYSAGLRARTFNTEGEVHAAGGTTQWGSEGQRPTFSRAVDLRMFIQKPDKVECGLFGIELDGKLYSPAVFTVDKLGFSKIWPTVQTAATFSLKTRGLPAGMWELSTDVKIEGGRTKVLPNIKLTGFNSPKVIEDLKGVFGS
jgi:hypothetical protein